MNGERKKKYGIYAAVVGIACNLSLFFLKLLIGYTVKSITIMADAFNNLSDGGSNILMLIGFNISAKPPDKEHPYGHGRMEYVTSLAISVIMMLVGLELIKASAQKILMPSEVSFSAAALVILLLSVILKLWLAFFYRRAAKKIESQTLHTASFDSLSDVVITLGIVFSLLFEKMTGIKIDGYTGVLVAGLIIFGGFKLAKEALDYILGGPIPKELAKKIRDACMEKEEIIGVHDLVVHSYGAENTMATIDVEMSSLLTLNEAHDVIDKIEQRVFEESGIRLLIHIDPIIVGNPKIDKYNRIISKLIDSIDSNIDMHSFTVNEEKDLRLSFELDLPHSYDGEKEELLISSIQKRAEQEIQGAICNIKIDKSFTKVDNGE